MNTPKSSLAVLLRAVAVIQIAMASVNHWFFTALDGLLALVYGLAAWGGGRIRLGD